MSRRNSRGKLTRMSMMKNGLQLTAPAAMKNERAAATKSNAPSIITPNIEFIFTVEKGGA